MATSQDNSAILTLPPGRLVWGSVHRARTVNKEGQPIIVKSGPNAGKPGQCWQFGVAIPKGAEQAWHQTQWGQKFLEVAQRGFPNGAYQRPDFSWKIVDGDSTLPNKEGRAPAATPHNLRHWIVACSTYASAPPVYRKNEAGQYVQVVGEEIIKPGYYVEVNIEVTDNAPSQSPGIFIGPRMVAFAGFGPEIISGPDVSQAGFGQAPLPAGASSAPVGGLPLPGMPAMGAPFPGTIAPNSLPVPNPLAGLPAAQPGMALPGQPAMLPPIQPNPAFLQPPANGLPVPGPAALLPPLQPLPVAQPHYVMTAAANGATREQYNAQGYTDAQLLAAGYMVQQ